MSLNENCIIICENDTFTFGGSHIRTREFHNSSQFSITSHWNLFTDVFHCILSVSGERYLDLASHKADSNVSLAGREGGGLSCCTRLSFERSA
jgi:hypothetical protein